MTIFIETKVLSNIIAKYFLFSISLSSLPYNYTSSINNKVINFALFLAEFERHVRGDIAILNCSGERESPRKIPLLIATSPINDQWSHICCWGLRSIYKAGMEIKRLLVRRLLVLIIILQWYKTTLTFNYPMVTISTVIDTRSRLQCIASIDEFHDKSCFYVRQLFFSIRLTFFAVYVTRVM